MFINGKRIDMHKEIIDTERDLQKDEVGFTYVHQYSTISLFKMTDFLKQVKLFQQAGMYIIPENIYDKEINGKSYTMLVFTPKNNSENYMCPMAMALGVMVCGFTYVIDATYKDILHGVKMMMKKP